MAVNAEIKITCSYCLIERETNSSMHSLAWEISLVFVLDFHHAMELLALYFVAKEICVKCFRRSIKFIFIELFNFGLRLLFYFSQFYGSLLPH